MKLLIVTNDFPPHVGGIEDFVFQLASHLPAAVTRVTLAPAHRDAAAFDAAFPHRVVRWPSFPLLPSPRLARAVASLAAAERADVIMFGAAMPFALIAGAVRRRVDVPIIACTHGVEPAAAQWAIARPALRYIARHSAILTAVSSWAEQHLRRSLAAGQRIERLPSGIDPSRFHPNVDGGDIRRRFALGEGPVIVCVSRLVPRKGQDQLIRALPAVARRFPSARLLLVGTGPDRDRLTRLVQRYGVADRVVFTGAVAAADVPACMAAGDLFAMPCRSRWFGIDNEALGAVYLQAAAVGRAAVAGRAGGAVEAVLDRETGLVVDGESTDAVTGALVSLLEDPATATIYGRQASARVHATMTWQAMAGRLDGWLRELPAAPGIRG